MRRKTGERREMQAAAVAVFLEGMRSLRGHRKIHAKCGSNLFFSFWPSNTGKATSLGDVEIELNFHATIV